MEMLGPYSLGHNPDNAGIYTGNSFDLVKSIPDQSINLIICDPVYWEIDQYKWLAREADRLLTEHGNVIAQAGYEYRYDAETAMYQNGGSLVRRPLLVETYTGGFMQLWAHRALNAYAPYIWMSRPGIPIRDAWVHTVVRGGGRDKSSHQWGDSPAAFFAWIEALTEPGDIVLDPFTGGGVVPACCAILGRRYLAFEIDDEVAERARGRMESFQMPLSADIFRQSSMELINDNADQHGNPAGVRAQRAGLQDG